VHTVLGVTRAADRALAAAAAAGRVPPQRLRTPAEPARTRQGDQPVRTEDVEGCRGDLEGLLDLVVGLESGVE